MHISASFSALTLSHSYIQQQQCYPLTEILFVAFANLNNRNKNLVENRGIQHKTNTHIYNKIKLLIICVFQLDCGIHPGLNGFASLPFLDLVDIEEIDLILVSQ